MVRATVADSSCFVERSVLPLIIIDGGAGRGVGRGPWESGRNAGRIEQVPQDVQERNENPGSNDDKKVAIGQERPRTAWGRYV